ncbi:MAG: hypothetical protein P8N76_09140, partial [Pirellulaceae bacterium]|nr:hypothetical protein [Pirellulaceae bacterium]
RFSSRKSFLSRQCARARLASRLGRARWNRFVLAKKAGEEITLFPFYLLPFFLAAVGGARLRNLGACITRKNEANVGRYSARFMSQAGVFVVKSPQPFSLPTKSTGNRRFWFESHVTHKAG